MSKDSCIALCVFAAGVLFVGQAVVLGQSLWDGVTDGSELSPEMLVLRAMSGVVVWPGIILMIVSAAVFIATLFAKSDAETSR